MAHSGTTVLLTTQYLEEADHLADRVVMIDRGRVIASGTADELKRRLAGERLQLSFADHDTFSRAVRAMATARWVATRSVTGSASPSTGCHRCPRTASADE